MIIDLQNVGPIKKATIETGDITIIAGPNNTGKTYASYILYDIYKNFHRYFSVRLDPSFSKDLTRTGNIEIDLLKYTKIIDRIFKDASKKLTENLPRIFSFEPGFFNKASVTVTLKSKISFAQLSSKTELSTPESQMIRLEKKRNSSIISVLLLLKDKSLTPPESLIKKFTSTFITKSLLHDVLKTPYPISSERTGAVLFYKELDMTRNRLIDLIKTDRKIINPIDLLFERTSTYVEAIRDNIETVRSYGEIRKRSSFLHRKADTDIFTLWSQLLGGKFNESRDQLYFLTQGMKSIPIHGSSSASKALFHMDVFIQHIAQKDSVLIIDEPEMNLHPKNQILLARLIVMLANKGIKIIVTTHSDTIVKELSICIMLNKLSRQEQKKMGYSEKCAISPDRIKMYFFTEHGHIQPLSVSKTGITNDGMDDVFSKQDSILANLFYRE